MSETSVQPAGAPQSPPLAAAARGEKAAGEAPAVDQGTATRRRRKNPAVLVLEVLASLRVTVVLFALSLLLVFFGTLAQIDAGIWTVVSKYFRSFFVWVPLQPLVQFAQVFLGVSKSARLPGAFPFPGGWTLGFALLVNLLAAHAVRFRLSWKRAGVLVLHFGLILMLVGEFITGVWAVEGHMSIEEGQTTNVVIESRKAELAVTLPGKDEDQVTVVPEGRLKKGGTIRDDDLPFDITVVKWMSNSTLARVKKGEENLADSGFGKERLASEQSETSGVASEQTVDMPSVYVTLTGKDGKELGTYLLSMWLKEQQITVDGKTYDVALRFQHAYKPYTLTLLEFRFDRYPGTDTPRNFSSRVRLRDPEYGEDREVTIRMNEPLRHRGETFFQANWNKETERGTVLQVVRNPAWQLPYWSCGIVAFGMIFHFGLNLVSFLRRRAG